MNSRRRSFVRCFNLKVFITYFFVCGISLASNAKTAGADDKLLRRRTPMELVRDTANFLSSEPDAQFLENLRDFRARVLKTGYLQLVKDVLDTGVFGNVEIADRTSHTEDGPRLVQVDAGDIGTGSSENGNIAAKTDPSARFKNGPRVSKRLTKRIAESSSGLSRNVPFDEGLRNSAAEYSATVSSSVTTSTVNLTTTSSPNATTPSPTPSPVDPKCTNDMARTLTAVLEKQDWALQMIDADGKPGPNLEGYQFLWVGDYEECTKIKAVDNSTGSDRVLFRGRYCNVVVPLQPLDTRPLMPSVPPSGIRIGLCVPDSCEGQDVTFILNEVLASRNSSYYVGLTTCQEETVDYDTKAIVALFICSLVLLLMVLGTAYDLLAVQWPAWAAAQIVEVAGEPKTTGDLDHDREHDNFRGNGNTNGPAPVNVENRENEPLLRNRRETFGAEERQIGTKGRLLLAFSVYTNGRKILDASHSPGSITCIHGIRFLSMTWVILGHTFVFGLTTAENYATYLSEVKGLWTFQAIIGAPAAVDTFFAISGLLVAYLILKEMEKRNGKVPWFRFYFHRFWRLTPPYAIVLMLLVALFRYLGDGPNWPQGGTEINSCQDTWWTNLLYVSNFVRVHDMCINWSWYLANDMQFYIVSPLLFVPLFYWRKVGVALAFLWLAATMVTTGVISRVNNFPPSISISTGTNMLESANYFFDLYIKPYCRIGPYVVGMLTGYVLFITKRQVKMNLLISLSGWAVATAAGLAVVYGLYGPSNGHLLTADVSALYNSMGHTVWGMCVCWVIFACATGHGGPVNGLLSWPAFIPLSRLTYMAYLVHPIIMNLYHLGAPSVFYMSTFHYTILFLGFTMAAYGTAFVLSLAFEAPMMALEKVLLTKSPKH